MNITENIVSTFIGSVFGFCFGIGVFYVTENIKTRRRKTTTTQNLMNELRYNIMILDKWMKELGVRKKWMSSPGRLVHFPIQNFSDTIQTHFLRQSLEQGLVFNKVDDKELWTIVDFIQLKDSKRENRINSMMEKVVPDQIGKFTSKDESELELELDKEIVFLKSIRDLFKKMVGFPFILE